MYEMFDIKLLVIVLAGGSPRKAWSSAQSCGRCASIGRVDGDASAVDVQVGTVMEVLRGHVEGATLPKSKSNDVQYRI